MNRGRWYTQFDCANEAFRHLLTNISSRIHDLHELKYQCHDWIGRGKLERINSCLELFNVLEERDKVCPNDVDFLITMLNNVKRKDLVRMVNEYKQYWLFSQEEQWTSKASYVNAGTYPGRKAFAGFSGDVKQDMGKSLGSSEDPPNCALPFSGNSSSDSGTAATLQVNARDPALIATMCEYLSYHLTHNWQATMRSLSIPDDVIAASIYNWPNNLRRQIRETLDYWKE